MEQKSVPSKSSGILDQNSLTQQQIQRLNELEAREYTSSLKDDGNFRIILLSHLGQLSQQIENLRQTMISVSTKPDEVSEPVEETTQEEAVEPKPTIPLKIKLKTSTPVSSEEEDDEELEDDDEDEEADEEDLAEDYKKLITKKGKGGK